MSIQKFVTGYSAVARRKNSFASSIVYGCGNKSRSPSQTPRLFACFASGRIVRTPRANSASLENELHDSVFVEFDSGLLHFAVRQKPDQRFVVKIDHLDAVAPWVVEIAAERRLEL